MCKLVLVASISSLGALQPLAPLAMFMVSGIHFFYEH